MLNIDNLLSDTLKDEYISIYNNTKKTASTYAAITWKEKTYLDAYINAELTNIDKQFEYKLEQLQNNKI